MFRIYRITCLPTGKDYVGCTQMTLTRRWQAHQDRARIIGQEGSWSGPLHEAIRKYGAEAFRVELVAVTQDPEEADRLETAAIEEYGSLYPGGYNLVAGGPHAARPLSTRQKLSERARNRTPEEKQRLREVAWGRRANPRQKAALAEGRKARWDDEKKERAKGEGNPNARINQEIADKIREAAKSATQARVAKQFGVSHSLVSLIVRGEIWKGDSS